MKRGRHTLLWALAFVFAASPLYAQAAAWRIDPQHTSVQFAITHMAASKVRGRFNKTTGTVTWDGKDFATAAVEIIVDAASIDTGVKERDDHLRTSDFMHISKYPTMTFKSTKIEETGAGRVRMSGNLTIRGVTKPVVFDVSGPSPPIKDPDGFTRVGATATGTINRKDFGLVWNRILEGGGALVGYEVAITIDIEVVNRGTAAPK
jgi:polyisoprenoid-binding protein YceI